jgi:hypothetical protein
MQLVLIVPDRNTGSCLDPGLPGTSLGRGKGEGVEAGPGLPNREEKDQLESSRDGGNIMRGKEEPIRDVMQEG